MTCPEVMPSSKRSHHINRLARDLQANSAEPCGSAPVDGGQNSGSENETNRAPR